MHKKLFVVMGATGQIGHVVVEHLFRKGHQVKALGRNPQKLQFLKTRGAEAIALENFDQEKELVEIFQGASGAFVMLPPGEGVDDLLAYQDRLGETIKIALERNSIPFVVNLSSLGADLPEGTGPIKGLHRQEKRLDDLSETRVIHLRPSYFMENLLWSIPTILKMGLLKTPLNPELSLPMIATPDIGIKAGDLLDQSDFQGHSTLDYVGPRPVNMVEVAKVLGEAIGNPDLQYAQYSYEEATRGMLNSGLKTTLAELMIEMYKALNNGQCIPTQKLQANNIGKTTLEQFAQMFANAYKIAEKEMAKT